MKYESPSSTDQVRATAVDMASYSLWVIISLNLCGLMQNLIESFQHPDSEMSTSTVLVLATIIHWPMEMERYQEQNIYHQLNNVSTTRPLYRGVHVAWHVVDRHAWKTVTQQEQDEGDDQKRREALRDLVESWMDRLQLISVIVSGFVELPMLPSKLFNFSDNFFCVHGSDYVLYIGARFRWHPYSHHSPSSEHRDCERLGCSFECR